MGFSYQKIKKGVFVLGESFTTHNLPHTKNQTISVVEFMASHMRLIDPQESGCMADRLLIEVLVEAAGLDE